MFPICSCKLSDEEFLFFHKDPFAEGRRITQSAGVKIADLKQKYRQSVGSHYVLITWGDTAVHDIVKALM